ELDRLGVEVSSAALHHLEATDAGWRVRTVEQHLDASAVVLATPAGPAATAVRDVAPKAATLLAGIPYASVALVALAVPRSSIDRELDGSGFLVPAVEGRTITACSWTSAKWPHQHGEGTVWLRASVGRDGRPPIDDDAVLEAAVLADLADTMALRGPVQEVRISRWPGSFPQYRPGHLRRVDATDEELAAAAPGVVVAGAALRGLGVPACIRQARAAAARVLQHLT
ncbi:MAG: protoporphyrinogen oxidase, partial [Actinomycetota bacterium]|nr:protoporphyrinogen oxidase [Actinomycetota bacterium]